MTDPFLIGRDRVLIDKLVKQLHDEARSHHNYGPIRQRQRGSSFEVQLLTDGKPNGRVARVTVELDRVEEDSS